MASRGPLTIPRIDGKKKNKMRITGKKILYDFCHCHADAKRPLDAWHKQVRKTGWTNPAAVRQQYGSASIIGNNRVVFNIKGNSYRLVVKINYEMGVVNVRFVGTHTEYNAVDAKVV